MHTLFISDLHLSHNTPTIAQNFLSLLNKQAGELDALYILGDLFEYWLGDDGITPQHHPILGAIKQIADNGVPAYFIRGNRDFLISADFADQTGCKILEDPSVIDLYGTPTLIMHGDALCTDDHAYQAFKKQVRDPRWQAHFLSLTMEQRIEMARQARDASQSSAKEKSMAIMDANQLSIENTMRESKVTTLIHGHTHRPAIHQFNVDGADAKRIVLGDWGDEASYLMVSDSETTLVDPRVTNQ